MIKQCISFDMIKNGTNPYISIDENKFIKKFIELPSKLYDKNTLTQDKRTELQLLNNSHILSNYFNIYPFILLNEDNDIIARCIITYYPNDNNAYIGYFECEENYESCKFILDYAIDMARVDKKECIIGPLNCSFWLGYRFKCDNIFDKPFTGEPYNKSYYVKFFQQYGFNTKDHYVTNYTHKIPKNSASEKVNQRLQKMIDKGYMFTNPNKKNFDKKLGEIYDLLIELYKNFPMFRFITKDEFCSLYKSLKYVLNLKMIHLVYFKDKLVGFCINIPNIYNLSNNLSIINAIKIFTLKNKPKEYVIMYLGVDRKHLGLGTCLIELTRKELEKHGQGAIGALIHDGKVSGGYYKELYEKQYEYVLMEKKISPFTFS